MVKYVIIGNGVAGTTAAEQIRKRDGNGRITLITQEPYSFYSRIRLIDFLADEATLQDIILKKDQWYQETQITLATQTQVTQIDPETHTIMTNQGKKVDYDKLLLATGGHPFVPPIPGANKDGVFSLRTIQDAQAIKEYGQPKKNHILLVGGGVLGLEAGNALRKRGCSITVVEFFPRLLPRQMDPRGAQILQTQMEDMGFTFHLDAKIQKITGGKKAEGVLLQNGTHIMCDMVLLSAGIRPNVQLTENLNVKVEKGLIVNDEMETGIPDIYAAGDLIQHHDRFYGIWPAAEKQGEVAGVNMSGGSMRYEGTTISNTLKVAGVDLVSTGNIDSEGKNESIIKEEKKRFLYKKLVLEENRITGAILYGDITGRPKILRAIHAKKDISDIRKELEDWNLENL